MSDRDIFLRFDDVGPNHDPNLDRFIEHTGNLNLHCLLGVIPLWLEKNRATILQHCSHCTVFQHGVSHENRATDKRKKDEFPEGLDPGFVYQTLNAGRTLLEEAVCAPISGYIPPWNFTSRSAIGVLESLGFQSFSASTRHRFETSLRELHTTVNVFSQYHPPLVKTNHLIKEEILQVPYSLVGIMFHANVTPEKNIPDLLTLISDLRERIVRPCDWPPWKPMC